MLFSILIPVFNAEQYIDKCLKSILYQTEEDYEIIIADDGSTDKSYSLCMNWQRQYPNKIHVIRTNRIGSLEARRECMRVAKGDYFYFIDADDYIIDKNALRIVDETIKETKCDLIIFNATCDEINRTKMYDYPFYNREVFEKESLNRVFKIMLAGTKLNTLWNKVFSRYLVDWQEDYSKQKEIVKGTDFYQILPIVSAAKKIVYLDDILYFYNTSNSSSISHQFNPLIYKTTCIQHKRLIYFSNSWRIESSEKEELLKQRFTCSVARIIILVYHWKEKSVNKRIRYLSMIKNDPFYNENHSLKGLCIRDKIAMRLLDFRLYSLLLIYIYMIGLYGKIKAR